MGNRLPIILVVLLLLFLGYWFLLRKQNHSKDPKMTPIALKKHTPEFNAGVDSFVNAYLDLKNAFVEADTAAVKKAAAVFIDHVDRFPLSGLKTDSIMVQQTVKANLTDIKSNTVAITQDTDITTMRQDFSSLTEQLFPSFFIAINYEGPKLYFENCPMAFYDSVSANWISNSSKIVNPYIGKNHPKYHSGMLDCGSVKDSLPR